MSGGGSSLGLRNWRGQIVEPLANFAAVDVEASASSSLDDKDLGDKNEWTKAKREKKEKKKKKKKSKSSRRRETDDEDLIVYTKDEFGRDVPLDRMTKHEKKAKKPSERSRSRSRSVSREGTRNRASTPPPADPFRPQLDDGRSQKHYRRRRSRSRSRSRSRERYRRHHDRTPRSRSRSKSRRHSRRKSRSRSRSSDRVWTHDGFENRSPSPIREIVPGYKPEPEEWVSRAGGVYIPRKPSEGSR